MADAGMTTRWQLDRRVPIVMVFGLLVQAGAVVWAMAVLFANVEENRDDIETLTRHLARLDGSERTQAVQLGRIEENVKSIQVDMGRVLRLIGGN